MIKCTPDHRKIEACKMNTIAVGCIFVIASVLVQHSDCKLNDLIKIDDEPIVGEPASPEKTFLLMSTGLSHIFWSHVMSSNFTAHTEVTMGCREALETVSKGLLQGDILPYHFVDASSKTPPGLIRATMCSLGDYDQCLAIDGMVEGVVMEGKYCAVDFFPVRVSLSNDRKYTDNMTAGKLTFDRISVFKRMPFIHSLCVPAQCSADDVRKMLSTGESFLRGGIRVKRGDFFPLLIFALLPAAPVACVAMCCSFQQMS